MRPAASKAMVVAPSAKHDQLATRRRAGRKPPRQIAGRATGVSGPVRHHPAEVDIEHDPAKIEQQRIDGVGDEGRIHGSPVQNWTGRGNGPGPRLPAKSSA